MFPRVPEPDSLSNAEILPTPRGYRAPTSMKSECVWAHFLVALSAVSYRRISNRIMRDETSSAAFVGKCLEEKIEMSHNPRGHCPYASTCLCQGLYNRILEELQDSFSRVFRIRIPLHVQVRKRHQQSHRRKHFSAVDFLVLPSQLTLGADNDGIIRK